MTRPTIKDCHAAGMTYKQAAEAMGLAVSTVYNYASRAGLRLVRDYSTNSEHMRALHADPEFAKARSERMKALHADPEFAKAHSERASKCMRALNADPEFAKANSERMKALNADPEFAKANSERASERMKALHADPERNPLVLLTADERADYDTLKRAGYSRNEAFRQIGREDLVCQ